MLPKNSCVWFFHTIEKGEKPTFAPSFIQECSTFSSSRLGCCGRRKSFVCLGVDIANRIIHFESRFKPFPPFDDGPLEPPELVRQWTTNQTKSSSLFFSFPKWKGRKSNLARYLAAFLRTTFGRSRTQTSSPPENRKLFSIVEMMFEHLKLLKLHCTFAQNAFSPFVPVPPTKVTLLGDRHRGLSAGREERLRCLCLGKQRFFAQN